MIKLVIFDYGRTLYDRDSGMLSPDAVHTVRTLAGKFRLAIVSVSPLEDESTRRATLKEHGIMDLFDSIMFTHDREMKSQLYDQTLGAMGLQPSEVAVVDDYIIRGIAWGSRVGATTIWFRNGKFADVMPDEHTGQPDYIINSLKELVDIL